MDPQAIQNQKQLSELLQTSPTAAAMATAAVGNISTYVASRLVGNDASFSWKSVAASVASAGITQGLVPTAETALGSSQEGLFRGITGGIGSAHVRHALTGDDVEYAEVFADAFGNMLGPGIAQAASRQFAPSADEAFFNSSHMMAALSGGGVEPISIQDLGIRVTAYPDGQGGWRFVQNQQTQQTVNALVGSMRSNEEARLRQQ
ncbi:hypothetical protein QE383_002995 [Pseudoxanthomonas winnipegensis]|uniref:Uncharacterized protein n=1 Tax=Pseudoxanthomonas winnipegensis TaxID=2480810 RepID=A0AAW8GFX9_9GAMM|nr:hypothetical protein [Pseudoxanthomonas winnipegensis]MDQ1120687.1 hypothetical protein [Pseudoxanthomonas winnipegensis]